MTKGSSFFQNRHHCLLLRFVFITTLFTPAGSIVQAVEQDSGADNQSLSAVIEDHFFLTGKIEFEASVEQDFNDNSSNSVDPEGIELTFESLLTDYLSGTFVLDWNGKKDRVDIDKMYMTISEGTIEDTVLSLQVGRFILPFGVYEGNTISDGFPEEMFEAKEDSIMLTLQSGSYYAWTCIFDGDTDAGGTHFLGHFGGGIGVERKGETLSYTAGIDIINSVFDAKGLSKEYPDALEEDYGYGLAMHGQMKVSGFIFLAEYVTALSTVEFTADDDMVGLKPGAWQIEFGYTADIADKESYIAFCYSQSKNLVHALPERRKTITIGMKALEELEIAFEYTHDDDYS